VNTSEPTLLSDRRGCLIALEGCDGAGKSSQAGKILEWLQEQGIRAILTKEPGGCPLGDKTREWLLCGENTLAPETELLLLFAARVEHIRTVIAPAIEQGIWVVCDRFVDASYAYQGAAGVETRYIDQLSQWLVEPYQPDLVLLFDASPELLAQRIHNRGAADSMESRHGNYHEKVRSIYLRRARRCPERYRIIDAGCSIAQVSAALYSILLDWIHRND